MTERMQRILRLRMTKLARLLVSLGILTVLLAIIDLDVMIEKFALLDLGVCAMVIALLCAQILIGALRWHTILGAVGTPLAPRQSIENYVAGSLGNIVFLNTIGGLSVRTFLLVRRGFGLKHIAAGLIAERLAVIVALLLVFFVAALIADEQYDQISSLITDHGPAVLLLAGIGPVLAGLVLLHFLSTSNARWVRGLARYVNAARRRPGQSAMVLVTSCATLLTGFAAVAMLASGIGVEIGAVEIFAVMPLVTVLSAIPVSLGGWGVREGSMVLIFSMLGVGAEETLAISVLYGLTGIVSALLLAASFLLRPKAEDK